MYLSIVCVHDHSSHNKHKTYSLKYLFKGLIKLNLFVFIFWQCFLLFRFSHFYISKHALQLSLHPFDLHTSFLLPHCLSLYNSRAPVTRPGHSQQHRWNVWTWNTNRRLEFLSLAGYSRLLPSFDEPQGAFRPFPHLLTVSLRESRPCFHTCGGVDFAAELQGPWE